MRKSVALNSRMWVVALLCGFVNTAFAVEPAPRKLAGHAGAVRAIAYSPDGKLLFSAGEDGKLLVRSRPGDKLLGELSLPGHAITALAISGDGKLLVVGTNGASLARLTLPKGEFPEGAALDAWGGVPGAVTTLALSSDGHWLVCGDAGGTTRLWDATTKQSVRDFAGAQLAVAAVTLSADDTLVCAATGDGGLRAWNRETGALLGTYFAAPSTTIVQHLKDKLLISGGTDGLLRQWRWPPEARANLAGHTDVAPSLALSANGKLALSGGHDGQVLFWNALEDKMLRPLPGAVGKVTAVAMSNDGAIAVAGAESGTLYFWNTTDAVSRGTIVGHKSPVTSLALNEQATHVAATYFDGAIRWWRLPEPNVTWQGHTAAITHLATSLDRHTIVTCGSDKSVRVWDAATGKVKRAVEALPMPPERCCLSADGAWFAWSDAAGRVQVEQTVAGKDSFGVQAQAGPLAGLALIEKGKTLVTAGVDGSLKYWPLPLSASKEIAKSSSKITASATVSNGRLLLGDEQGVVRLLTPEGKETAKLQVCQTSITSLALLADGNSFVAANAQGQIYVAAANLSSEAVAASGHTGAITAIAPHPTEARFATTGADGTIRIWRTPQSKQLTGHDSAITATAISPDGRLGLTADKTGTLHRWNLTDGRHDTAITTGDTPLTSVRFQATGGGAAGDTQGDVHFLSDEVRETTDVLGTHDAALSQLAFHPAAPLLATASADGRVRVWNVQNPGPAVLARLEKQPARIAMTSDQARLFVACDDGSLAAYDLNANTQAWKKRSFGAAATCLAVSHDNSTLAIGLPSGEVQLIAALDGLTKGTIGTGYTPVRSICFRPGGAELATAHDDNVIRVWKLPTAPQLWTDHDGNVTLVAAAAQGPLFATAAEDRTVRLWSSADPNPSWVLGHAQPVLGLTTSIDGARLATITAGAARVWSAVDGSLVREWKLAAPGTSIALSADGKQLWTGHANGKLAAWNVDDGVNLRTLEAHTKRIAALVRIGTLIATAGDDGQLRLWPAVGEKSTWAVATPSPLVALSTDAKETALLGRDTKGQCFTWALANGDRKQAATGEFRASAVSTAGRFLAVDSGRGVELHQADASPPFQSSGLLERFPHAEKMRGQLSFLNDDLGIVAGDAKGRVALWRRSLIAANQTTSSRVTTLTYLEGRDRPTMLNRAGRLRHFDGSEIAAIPGLDDITTSAATRDGNRIAVLGGLKSLLVWDHKLNRVAANISMPVAGKSVSISGDGLRAAVVGDDGLARVWQLDPPRQLRRIGSGEKIVEAILSTAGDWLAVAFENGDVRRYAAGDQAEVASHGPGVTACAWWPGGERFLSAGADRYLRFYDRDYKPQGQIGPFDFPVQALAVKADGTQVLVGDQKTLYVLRGDNLQIERKHEIPGGVIGIHFLGTGANAVLACGDNRLRTVQVADARVLEELVCEHATSSFGAFAAPEGVSLLAAGPNNSALLARGTLERMIVGHQGAVNCIAWAANGTMLVSGGVDKTVRQWNVADGAQQRIFAGHADAVTSVAMSHDAATVFAAGLDRTLRAWPLAEPARQLFAFTSPAVARHVRLSADSTRVYTGGDDNDLRMLDAINGRLIEQIPLPAASQSLVVSADGKSLVSVGADNVIRSARPSCSKLVSADATKLHELVPLAGDDGVAVSCEDKTTKLFNAQGTLLRPLAGQPHAAGHIAMAMDGKSLAVGGDAAATQPVVWAWDPNDARHLLTLTLPANVVAIAMSPQGRLVVSCADRRVLFYEQGQLIEELTLPVVASRLLYLSHGSVAALTGDKDLLLLKPACEQRFVGQQGAMNAAAVSPEGKLLYTGGNEPLLRVWNTATGQQVSSAAITAGVQQLRVSALGNQVVAAGLDGKLSRWEAASFKKEQAGPAAVSIQLPNVAHGLTLSPDGQRAVTGGDDGWLRHFDLTSGQELERQGPLAAAVLSSAWSPETGLVLASSADKLLTRNRLGILKTHEAFKEPVRALALSGDGARLASVDATGKLIIATLASGATVAQQLPSKAIHRLAWSPDDKELAVATAEGILLVTVLPAAKQTGTKSSKYDK